VVKALTELAEQRGMTFSDVARDALVAYLGAVEPKTSVSAVYSLANASVILSGGAAGSWPQTRASTPDAQVTVRDGDRDLDAALTGTS
jgi:hypothetical protein